MALPIIWFVAVAVARGSSSSAIKRYAVRATTKQLAVSIAENRARNDGHTVKQVYPPISGDFKTAGGAVIRVGGTPSKANGFPTFAAFKNRWGAAGKGRQWHHIVEQGSRGVKDGRYPAWAIHNRHNLVNIRTGLHQKCINAIMATKLKNLDRRERDALKIRVVRANREQTTRRSFEYYTYENSHLFGLRLLNFCGVDVGV